MKFCFCPLNTMFFPLKGSGWDKVNSQADAVHSSEKPVDWLNKFFVGKACLLF